MERKRFRERRFGGYLVSFGVGFAVAAVSNRYGFPGVLFAAIVVGGVGLLFLGSERDPLPLTASAGFIFGLAVVSGAVSIP